MHRLAQRRAHNGGDQRFGNTRSGELAGQFPGDIRQHAAGHAQQRKPGTQQKIGVARHAGGAHGREPLGDQLIGALRIRRAQQCLGQAHERLALRAVERELLEHGVDERTRTLIGTRHLHPALRAHLPGLEHRTRRLERREHPGDSLGFWP